MSKDLTEALRAMMAGDANTNIMPALKPRGAAPAVTSAAPLPGGASAPAGNNSFTADGAKTMVSTDGLFALVFPDTLKTTLGGAVLTVPVVKKVTP